MESRSRSRSKTRSSGAGWSLTSSESVASKDLEVDSGQSMSNFNTRSALFERYDETWAALNNLQNSLKCHNNCQATEHVEENKHKEIFSLGVCEHRFCRSCMENNENSMCQVCSMPYRSTNVHIDKQLSNISALCTRLFDIFAGKVDEIESDLTSIKGKGSNENTKAEIKVTLSMQGEDKLNESSSKSHVETRRDPRRSDKESLSKHLDSREIQKTHEKSKRTVERIFDTTPSNLENDKAFSPFEKVQQSKRKTSRGRAFPNVTQDSSSKPGVAAEVIQGRTGSPAISRKKGGSNQGVHRSADEANRSLERLKQEKSNSSHTLTPNHQMSPNCETEGKNLLKRKKAHSLSPATKKCAAQQGNCKSVGKGNITILEKRNAKGETPLQVAAVKANYQKVQELLAAGANPNVKDNAGWTPLHEAVNHGNAKIAEVLLDHGASVNTPGLENETPLHDAVSNYSLDCVRLLVKRGANVTARNTHGQTALDMAKTEDMREALIIPDGTTAAPQENTFMEEDISTSGRLCFVTSSLSKEQLASAHKCVKLLDCKLVEDHCSEVTHSISGVNTEGLCPRTLKYLTAILCGVWIVTPDWIDECLQQSQRVAEENFEVSGCVTKGSVNAPQKARLNRLKKLPGLFDGCQFYFHGKFQYPTPSKEQLIQLAKLGGGAILTREPRLYNLDDYPYTVPYHATATSSLADCAIFVIYDDSCPNPPKVKAQRMSYLPASWLLDSTASFTLLEKTDYLKL